VAAAKQRPIQEGLFTFPEAPPRLVASRCKRCSELTFPSQDACPACTATGCEEVLLGGRGTLWTWTIQRFSPPLPYLGERDPERFVPFGVGYVELPEGIRVEGRLSESDAERLAIGMEMELVLERFAEDEDGTEVVTFAFRPAGG